MRSGGAGRAGGGDRSRSPPPAGAVLLEGRGVGGLVLASLDLVRREHLVVGVTELVEADVTGDAVEVRVLDLLRHLVAQRLTGLAGVLVDDLRERLDDGVGRVERRGAVR